MTLTIPVIHPAKIDVIMETAFSFSRAICSYNKYPNTTTVGPNIKLIIRLPFSKDSKEIPNT